MSLFDKGIYLEQHKEPAFSHDLLLAEGISFPKFSAEKILAMPNDYLYKVMEFSKIRDEFSGMTLLELANAAIRQRVHTLVINAADDDPYTSSSVVPLLRHEDYALLGARLFARVVRAKELSIAVNSEIDTDGTMYRYPDEIDGVEVKKIRKRYPIASRVGECYQEKTAVVGVGALINFAKTIIDGETSRICFVTVAGDCVARPVNVAVPSGTPIRELFAMAGGCKPPQKIILGAMMTGRAVESDEIGVEVTTKSLIALSHYTVKTGLNCIGCGRCVRVCPKHISPYYLYKCSKRGIDAPTLFKLAEQCDLCGCCSYVCPGTCNPTHYIKLYKKKVQASAAKEE